MKKVILLSSLFLTLCLSAQESKTKNIKKNHPKENSKNNQRDIDYKEAEDSKDIMLAPKVEESYPPNPDISDKNHGDRVSDEAKEKSDEYGYKNHGEAVSDKAKKKHAKKKVKTSK